MEAYLRSLVTGSPSYETSQTRQTSDLEDQVSLPEEDTTTPSLSETNPLNLNLNHDEEDTHNMFSSPTDTSNSHNSSITIEGDLHILRQQGQPLGHIRQVDQSLPFNTNPPERLLGPEQLGPDKLVLNNEVRSVETDKTPKQQSITSHRLEHLRTIIELSVPTGIQWIYQKDPETWLPYLSEGSTKGWSFMDPLHPAMEDLLMSPTMPLWAAPQHLTCELSEIKAAFQALTYAEQTVIRLLSSNIQSEDDVKTFLKTNARPDNQMSEKLHQNLSHLIEVCSKATNLPLNFTSAIQTKALTSRSLINDVHNKIAKVRHSLAEGTGYSVE